MLLPFRFSLSDRYSYGLGAGGFGGGGPAGLAARRPRSMTWRAANQASLNWRPRSLAVANCGRKSSHTENWASTERTSSGSWPVRALRLERALAGAPTAALNCCQLPGVVRRVPALRRRFPAVVRLFPADRSTPPASVRTLPDTLRLVPAVTRDVSAVQPRVPAKRSAFPVKRRVFPANNPVSPGAHRVLPAALAPSGRQRRPAMKRCDLLGRGPGDRITMRGCCRKAVGPVYRENSVFIFCGLNESETVLKPRERVSPDSWRFHQSRF
jgi:hypothetical protein